MHCLIIRFGVMEWGSRNLRPEVHLRRNSHVFFMHMTVCVVIGRFSLFCGY